MRDVQMIENVVARDGVEPPTPAFSGLASPVAICLDQKHLSRTFPPKTAHLIAAKTQPKPRMRCLPHTTLHRVANCVVHSVVLQGLWKPHKVNPQVSPVFRYCCSPASSHEMKPDDTLSAFNANLSSVVSTSSSGTQFTRGIILPFQHPSCPHWLNWVTSRFESRSLSRGTAQSSTATLAGNWPV